MTQSPPAPRRSRLQFSLRVLLLALTAFAVGFPIWYRWPYEETKYRFPNDDETKPAQFVMHTGLRRTWGGGEVLHGRSVTEGLRGKFKPKTIEHYQEGKRHGPYEHYINDKLVRSGQYEQGQREGVWATYSGSAFDPFTARSSGAKSVTMHWHHDRLDGPYLINGEEKYKFAMGRLLGADGKPIRNRLVEQLEAGTIDNVIVASELSDLMPVGMDFVETPLKETIVFLQDLTGLPFVIDTRRIADIDRPVTFDIQGVDLCSALTLLTAEVDLAFEYRYGVMFLTTKDNVQNWRDTTGVADIRPPAGGPLAQAWNEPLAIEILEIALEPSLKQLAEQASLRVDLSALPPETRNKKVSFSLKGLPLRHILGFVLDRERLRCEARGPDTLVILTGE